ncbi:MAG: nitroreductase family protein [Miltoncostaeaceae bacterium]
MDALEAIRHRRAVRSYTDRPVSEEDIDALLKLALLAPTGHMAQAWSFVVVREAEQRAALADLVLRGGADYFREGRPPKEGTSAEEHAQWAADYAEQALGTYRDVPVWICGITVPRFSMEHDVLERIERFSDVTSVSFALENLFVAARAMGLGTTPTIFHLFHEDEFRELLNLPDDVEAHYLTPLGYPTEFPKGLRPAVAKSRRPWRSLVHDEKWGSPRAEA